MDVARHTKLFCPAAVLQSGIGSLSLLRVFREWIFDRKMNWSHKYSGAYPFMHLNAIMPSLYLIID